MPRYEHRVYRVLVDWDGGDYYLAAMVQKNDWTNADHLGEMGWEFVAFVPNHEVYIKDSFPQGILELVRMAVFKRQMKEDEDMEWGTSRTY
jgi:hypothetical protein